MTARRRASAECDLDAKLKRHAIEIIFDASGSMLQRFEGKRRIDVANRVLKELHEDAQTGMPAALRVFGNDKPGFCEPISLLRLLPLT